MTQRIFLFFFSFFFLFASAQAENQRDIIFFWENGGVKLIGHHRPYARLEIEENGQKITETIVSAKGRFEILLSLDPEEFYDIVLRAFDHFDQEIKNEKGDSDILRTRISPGVSRSGKVLASDGTPIAGAKIELFDTEGTLLNRFFSDENGNYSLAGIPRGAEVKISGEDFEEEKIPTKNLSSEIVIGFAEGSTREKTILDSPRESVNNEQKSGVFLWIFWGLIGVIVVTIGGVLIWKRKMQK